MTFSVRQAIADADLAPFPIEDAHGVTRELPHLKALTARQLLRLLRDGEIEEVLTEVGTDPELVAQIGDWPGHVLEPLLADWMEHSDVRLPGGAPGKSRPSSASSTSTPPPSRRTSRGGGSTSRR